MNLSEINWDLNAAGSWPNPLKITAVIIICILVVIGDIYFITFPQLDDLTASKKEELTAKASFEEKQKKAVNLSNYRDQLDQIETSLSEMLKQMPTKAEVANLLVDISQTGLASGLEFKLFQPGSEVSKDFYSELPINIQVIGKFEQLGVFVSGLASLPRIVTVHDVNISPLSKDSKDKNNSMIMSAVIKTYNEGVPEDKAKSAKKRKDK